MATKEIKRHVKGLIEGLESRIHAGPPVRDAEILSAREFLLQNHFSPSSDYFNRLWQIQNRLSARPKQQTHCGKRNYGGEAGGRWMQLQSTYDHAILSTCYQGEFNRRRGRIKISHRFNLQGRIDFVELKYLQSLEPCLTGEMRKLVMISGYQTNRKDWLAAQAFVLPVLPRELIFLYAEIFHCPRTEVLAWLINVGHGILDDLRVELEEGNGEAKPDAANGATQLCLPAVRSDGIAWPIIQRACSVECNVEAEDEKTVIVRYVRK